MKKLIILAAASAALATPAYAQQAGDMSGIRVGALIGLDSVSVDDGANSGSEEDFLYGGFVGYDHDFGSFVLGAEAEIADSSVSQSATNIFVAGDSATLKAARDIYVGVRAGFKISANGMVYAKGGYTNAQAKLSYTDATGTVTGSDELDGVRLGAGAEFKVMENAFVRLEYRYSDYGEYDFQGVATGLDANRHQGVVGFGFLF